MYIYWPVILIFVTALILFFPLRTLYHRSRGWFAYSLVSRSDTIAAVALLIYITVAPLTGRLVPGRVSRFLPW